MCSNMSTFHRKLLGVLGGLIIIIDLSSSGMVPINTNKLSPSRPQLGKPPVVNQSPNPHRPDRPQAFANGITTNAQQPVSFGIMHHPPPTNYASSQSTTANSQSLIFAQTTSAASDPVLIVESYQSIMNETENTHNVPLEQMSSIFNAVLNPADGAGAPVMQEHQHPAQDNQGTPDEMHFSAYPQQSYQVVYPHEVSNEPHYAATVVSHEPSSQFEQGPSSVHMQVHVQTNPESTPALSQEPSSVLAQEPGPVSQEPMYSSAPGHSVSQESLPSNAQEGVNAPPHYNHVPAYQFNLEDYLAQAGVVVESDQLVNSQQEIETSHESIISNNYNPGSPHLGDQMIPMSSGNDAQLLIQENMHVNAETPLQVQATFPLPIASQEAHESSQNENLAHNLAPEHISNAETTLAETVAEYQASPVASEISEVPQEQILSSPEYVIAQGEFASANHQIESIPALVDQVYASSIAPSSVADVHDQLEQTSSFHISENPNHEYSAEITALSPEIPALSSEIPALSSEIPALSSEIPSLSSEIPALSSEIPALSSEIPALSPEIPVLSSEIPAMSSEIPTLSSGIPEMSSEIPALSSEIPTLSSELSELSSEIPEISSEIPSFSSQVPALPSEVSALSSEIPSISSEVPALLSETSALLAEPSALLAEQHPALLEPSALLAEQHPALLAEPSALLAEQHPALLAEPPALSSEVPEILSGAEIPSIQTTDPSPSELVDMNANNQINSLDSAVEEINDFDVLQAVSQQHEDIPNEQAAPLINQGVSSYNNFMQSHEDDEEPPFDVEQYLAQAALLLGPYSNYQKHVPLEKHVSANELYYSDKHKNGQFSEGMKFSNNNGNMIKGNEYYSQYPGAASMNPASENTKPDVSHSAPPQQDKASHPIQSISRPLASAGPPSFPDLFEDNTLLMVAHPGSLEDSEDNNDLEMNSNAISEDEQNSKGSVERARPFRPGLLARPSALGIAPAYTYSGGKLNTPLAGEDIKLTHGSLSLANSKNQNGTYSMLNEIGKDPQNSMVSLLGSSAFNSYFNGTPTHSISTPVNVNTGSIAKPQKPLTPAQAPVQDAQTFGTQANIATPMNTGSFIKPQKPMAPLQVQEAETSKVQYAVLNNTNVVGSMGAASNKPQEPTAYQSYYFPQDSVKEANILINNGVVRPVVVSHSSGAVSETSLIPQLESELKSIESDFEVIRPGQSVLDLLAQDRKKASNKHAANTRLGKRKASGTSGKRLGKNETALETSEEAQENEQDANTKAVTDDEANKGVAAENEKTNQTVQTENDESSMKVVENMETQTNVKTDDEKAQTVVEPIVDGANLKGVAENVEENADTEAEDEETNTKLDAEEEENVPQEDSQSVDDSPQQGSIDKGSQLINDTKDIVEIDDSKVLNHSVSASEDESSEKVHFEQKPETLSEEKPSPNTDAQIKDAKPSNEKPGEKVKDAQEKRPPASTDSKEKHVSPEETIKKEPSPQKDVLDGSKGQKPVDASSTTPGKQDSAKPTPEKSPKPPPPKEAPPKSGPSGPSLPELPPAPVTPVMIEPPQLPDAVSASSMLAFQIPDPNLATPNPPAPHEITDMLGTFTLPTVPSIGDKSSNSKGLPAKSKPGKKPNAGSNSKGNPQPSSSSPNLQKPVGSAPPQQPAQPIPQQQPVPMQHQYVPPAPPQAEPVPQQQYAAHVPQQYPAQPPQQYSVPVNQPYPAQQATGQAPQQFAPPQQYAGPMPQQYNAPATQQHFNLEAVEIYQEAEESTVAEDVPEEHEDYATMEEGYEPSSNDYQQFNNEKAMPPKHGRPFPPGFGSAVPNPAFGTPPYGGPQFQNNLAPAAPLVASKPPEKQCTCQNANANENDNNPSPTNNVNGAKNNTNDKNNVGGKNPTPSKPVKPEPAAPAPSKNNAAPGKNNPAPAPTAAPAPVESDEEAEEEADSNVRPPRPTKPKKPKPNSGKKPRPKPKPSSDKNNDKLKDVEVEDDDIDPQMLQDFMNDTKLTEPTEMAIPPKNASAEVDVSTPVKQVELFSTYSIFGWEIPVINWNFFTDIFHSFFVEKSRTRSGQFTCDESDSEASIRSELDVDYLCGEDLDIGRRDLRTTGDSNICSMFCNTNGFSGGICMPLKSCLCYMSDKKNFAIKLDRLEEYSNNSTERVPNDSEESCNSCRCLKSCQSSGKYVGYCSKSCHCGVPWYNENPNQVRAM